MPSSLPARALLALVLLAPARALAQEAPVEVRETPLGELPLVRPLLEEHRVALVHWWDGGAQARVSLFARVHAPLAAVRAAVRDVERYPSLLPALSSAEVLSRAGRSTAFSATVSVGPVQLAAQASMREVNERRLDFALTESPAGPAAARWELEPEGPQSTVVLLTVVSDPSQGSWLVRQLTGSSRTAATSGGLAVATALLQGVARGAERDAGYTRPSAPPSAGLSAPPAGPWLGLLDRYNTALLRLDAAGEVSQVSTGDRGAHSMPRVLERLRAVEQWRGFWPWARASRLGPATDGSERVHLALAEPFNGDEGEVTLRVEPAGSARVDGTQGALAGEHHRFDAFPAQDGDSYLLYTTDSATRHLPSLLRLVVERVPAAGYGMAAFWATAVLRAGFSGYR